jgi:hypothetical protein
MSIQVLQTCYVHGSFIGCDAERNLHCRVIKFLNSSNHLIADKYETNPTECKNLKIEIAIPKLHY